MHVRQLAETDIGAVVVLAEAMHAESKYAHLPFSHARVLELLHQSLSSSFVLCLVVEGSNKEVIGGAVYHIAPLYFSTRFVANDLGVFVAQQHRSYHVISALVKAAEHELIKLGASTIMYGVSGPVDPRPTSQLYAMLGYNLTGVMMSKELG